jgi:hypothetical protein
VDGALLKTVAGDRAIHAVDTERLGDLAVHGHREIA